MVYVYNLFDTKINTPIYVGATKQPQIRLKAHLYTTIKNYPNKENVVINIIDQCTEKQAGKYEKKYFLMYKELGYPLLNNSSKHFYKNPSSSIYTLVDIAYLSIAFKKSVQTIERWIKSKDDRLESDKARATLLSYKKLST